MTKTEGLIMAAYARAAGVQLHLCFHRDACKSSSLVRDTSISKYLVMPSHQRLAAKYPSINRSSMIQKGRSISHHPRPNHQIGRNNGRTNCQAQIIRLVKSCDASSPLRISVLSQSTNGRVTHFGLWLMPVCFAGRGRGIPIRAFAKKKKDLLRGAQSIDCSLKLVLGLFPPGQPCSA